MDLISIVIGCFMYHIKSNKPKREMANLYQTKSKAPKEINFPNTGVNPQNKIMM
jgi:hypothetical protein